LMWSFLRVGAGHVAEQRGPKEAVWGIPTRSAPKAEPIELDKGFHGGGVSFTPNYYVRHMPNVPNELHEA